MDNLNIDLESDKTKENKNENKQLSTKKLNNETNYRYEDENIYEDEEEYTAVEPESRFTSILGKKQFLKFRQIFTMERPPRQKNMG